MPSINIGSSSIGGEAFALTGPAGNTGPRGDTGGIGLLGITAGPTGATGVYIVQVTTLEPGIYFYLSSGITVGPISGFTGPNITYFNSKGVCGAFGSDYVNIFSYVTGGMTFGLRGICGDREYTTVSLSSDNTEAVITVNGIPSGSVLYGTTTEDFLAFTNSSYTATASRIRIEGQITEDNGSASSFTNQFNYGVLEFGLTANPSLSPVSEVKSFIDTTTPFLNVNSLNRNFIPDAVVKTDGIKSVDSGGYVLDLDKSSVFKLTTPIGITAFSRKLASNQLRSWLFFIEGSDVWNFPANVFFESGITGLQNYGFGSGMNILRVETLTDGGQNFYTASFVDRFFGSNPLVVQYGGIGSCCHAAGCQEYVTQEYCQDVLAGTYTALVGCENSCRVGSCCIDGSCEDNVTESICTSVGGVWNTQSCSLRGPCNLYHILEKVQPAGNQTLLLNNTASDDNPETIAVFKVKTSDSNTRIVIPSSIIDEYALPHQFFKVKDISGNYDTGGQYVISTPPGTDGITFALQFTNNLNNVLSDTPYSPINYTIQLKDSSGVEKTNLTYSVKPNPIPICAGRPNSKLIKTGWLANRYCRDCYTNLDGSSVNYFYNIQNQYGSCDFCVDLVKTGSNYTVTPVCVATSAIEDVNDCSITKLNEISSIGPALASGCKHSEWGIGAGANVCTGDCTEAAPVFLDDGSVVDGCKGVSLSNQNEYPYWHEVSIENLSDLYLDLTTIGITLETDQNYITTNILNFLKTSNNTANEKAVLFTPENQNIQTTFIPDPTLASCCPAEPDDREQSIRIAFDTNTTRYFVIYVTTNVDSFCVGNVSNPKFAGPCTTRKSKTVSYAIVVKVYVFTGTDTIDTSQPNCVTDVIKLSDDTEDCFSSDDTNCSVTGCNYSRDSIFNIDRIEEIKITDAIKLPGFNYKLNLNRISVPSSNCSNTLNYIWELKTTPNWYTTRTQYASIEAQLYQLFWYPLVCGACDGSVRTCDASADPCTTLCFCENGNPFAASPTETKNINCTVSPADFRTVIIDKTVSGNDTILTPRIFGGSPVQEQTGEYFYYTLGHPSDPIDPGSIYEEACGNSYFKIQKALSGTSIVIPSSVISNNEFVVYYTNGENVPFYNWPYFGCETTPRSAPVRIVKKYKDPNASLPTIDFTPEVNTDYQTGTFFINIKAGCALNSPNCIPVDDSGGWFNTLYAGTNWELGGIQYNYWYDHNAGNINFTEIGSFSDPESTAILSPDGEFMIFSNFPTTGYHSVGNINFYITVTVVLVDQTNPNILRTVEKTKVVSVPRTAPSLTDSERRLNKYKLLTDQNGNTECVLMDCSVTTDCNTLPDC
jgi:hypothetical protein